MASFRIRREIQYYEVMLDLSDGCVLHLTLADHGNKTHSNTESLVETLNIYLDGSAVTAIHPFIYIGGKGFWSKSTVDANEKRKQRKNIKKLEA